MSGIMLNRIKTERNIVLCAMWYRYGHSYRQFEGKKPDGFAESERKEV